MNWIAFSYSLPSSQTKSSHRVTLWRRLRQLGAVAPKSGVYVLPDREECLESLQWLAEEVQQNKGEAIVMRVKEFEGLQDTEIIKAFHDACKKEYEGMHAKLSHLEKHSLRENRSRASQEFKNKLEKLRKDFLSIAQIDFFNSPHGKEIAKRFKKIGEKASCKAPTASLPSLTVSSHQHKIWVTRPRPHVDRLGCAWLIRRFIDKNARIRYSNAPEGGEIAFDMKGVLFGHHGNLCSFETMATVFGLNDPALSIIAEIIHEIDLRDARYFHAETEGIAAILKGWIRAGFSDGELERHGMALFEGLYAVFNTKMSESGR